MALTLQDRSIVSAYHVIVGVVQVRIASQVSVCQTLRRKAEEDQLNHVVGHPEPHVLEISRGLGGDVHHQARGVAALVDAALRGRAFLGSEVGARGTTNSGVAVYRLNNRKKTD